MHDLPLHFATARETLDFVQESSVLLSSTSAAVGEGGCWCVGEGPALAQCPEGRVEVALQTARATQFCIAGVSTLPFSRSVLLYFLKGNEGNLIPSKQSFGTFNPTRKATFSMSRAQPCTLCLVHCVAPCFPPLSPPIFAGTSMEPRRGAGGGRWSSLEPLSAL